MNTCTRYNTRKQTRMSSKTVVICMFSKKSINFGFGEIDNLPVVGGGGGARRTIIGPEIIDRDVLSASYILLFFYWVLTQLIFDFEGLDSGGLEFRFFRLASVALLTLDGESLSDL